MLTATVFFGVAAPAGAVPPPPINPSDDEISQSENSAAAFAAEVGRLSGLVTKTQGDIDRLKADLELQAELALKARVDLDMANDDARMAKVAAIAAAEAAVLSQAQVSEAERQAREFAAASFRQGSTLGSISALLDAGSLNDLLERQQLINSISESQLDVMERLERARINRSNADAAARQATLDANAAQAAADAAATLAQQKQDEANDAFSAGQAQLAKLESQLAQQQIEYTAAVNTVAVLKDQRAQYNDWLELKRAEEERLRREAEERARLAAEKAAQERAAAAAAAAKAEADRIAAKKAAEEAAAEAIRKAAEKAAKEAAAEAERKELIAAAEEKIRKAQEAAAKAEEAARKAEELERRQAAEAAEAAKREAEKKAADAAREAARIAREKLEKAKQEKAEFEARQEAQRKADEAKDAANADDQEWDPNEPTPTVTTPPTPVVTPEPDPEPNVNPQPSPSDGTRGDIIVNAALQWIGTTYAWGGGNSSGPTYGIRDYGVADSFGDYMKIGFDCSGLALYAYAKVGVYLPHYSAYQYMQGQRISQSNLQRGDLVFWARNTADPNTIHHVAIWMGDGNILEAQQSGTYVKISPMRWSGYIGASRPGT